MIFEVYVTLDFGLPCLLLKPRQLRVIKKPLAIVSQSYYSPYVDYLIPISGIQINGFMMFSDNVNTVGIPNHPRQLYLDTNDPDAYDYIKQILQYGGFTFIQNINALQSFINSCNVNYNSEYDDYLLFYALDDSITDGELKAKVEERLLGLEQSKKILEAHKQDIAHQALLNKKLSDLEDDIDQFRKNEAEYQAEIEFKQIELSQLQSEIENAQSQKQELANRKEQQTRDKLLISKGIIPDEYKEEYESYKPKGE